jgi:hypothetical protein
VAEEDDMATPVDDNQTTPSDSAAQRRSTGAVVSFVSVVVAGILLLGTGYYAYTTRGILDSRLADLDEGLNRRLAEQIQGIRRDTASLTTDIAAVTERATSAAHEAGAARELGTALKRAHDRTARTVGTQAADIKAIQQAARTLETQMTARIEAVSTEVRQVAGGLSGTRNDVADNRRQIMALKTEVGTQVANNTKAVAELQRVGEREWLEFDVVKSSRPASPKVANVRIQLAKTDVRKGKYDVVLHFDDRQIERKDRTIGEPVQFLVGPERQRYELVVTDMERDRIRGYLSVSSVGAIRTKQVAVR